MSLLFGDFHHCENISHNYSEPQKQTNENHRDVQRKFRMTVVILLIKCYFVWCHLVHIVCSEKIIIKETFWGLGVMICIDSILLPIKL